MKYLNPKFTVGGYSKEYAKRYDKAFQKSERTEKVKDKHKGDK